MHVSKPCSAGSKEPAKRYLCRHPGQWEVLDCHPWPSVLISMLPLPKWPSWPLPKFVQAKSPYHLISSMGVLSRVNPAHYFPLCTMGHCCNAFEQSCEGSHASQAGTANPGQGGLSTAAVPCSGLCTETGRAALSPELSRLPAAP